MALFKTSLMTAEPRSWTGTVDKAPLKEPTTEWWGTMDNVSLVHTVEATTHGGAAWKSHSAGGFSSIISKQKPQALWQE